MRLSLLAVGVGLAGIAVIVLLSGCYSTETIAAFDAVLAKMEAGESLSKDDVAVFREMVHALSVRGTITSVASGLWSAAVAVLWTRFAPQGVGGAAPPETIRQQRRRS